MEGLGAKRAPASDRYVSLIKLASGGTATVYAGLDVATGELVALKRPHEHLTGEPSFLRSLRAEVSIASRIDHPNVVRVLDVEQGDEVIRLVMPYVRGAALSELLVAASRTRHRIDPAAVLRIVADACGGLHAAHELRDEDGKLLGIVHRDVSPHNLMVGADGVTRVTDFGIAKSVDVHVEHSTTTGVLKGKFAYMAPEYIRGDEIDRRADVFALGVVLWEALAGERLFKGHNQIDSSRKVLEKSVPSLATIAPELARFDPIIAMALEKEPEARVHTAAAWLDALQEAPMASHEEVARVVQELVGEALAERQALIQRRLLVMAEVTSTGAHTLTRDTLTGTGFDPEDLAPTLVLPVPAAEVSGSQLAHAVAEAPTVPDPVPVPAQAPALEKRGRGRGWILAGVGAAALFSAGVLAFAELRARQDAGAHAALAGAASVDTPKPLVSPAPSASSRLDPVSSPPVDQGAIDVTSLPRPSAHPAPALPRLAHSATAARAAPSASTAAPAADTSIVRRVDFGGRPNPYPSSHAAAAASK